MTHFRCEYYFFTVYIIFKSIIFRHFISSY
nr:MAG TPA: hypothetical protein [Bacteriophage sp.]